MALTKVQEGMLVALNLIKQDGPRSNKMGMCHSVIIRMPYAAGVYPALEELFLTWPKFSGSITFPVPNGVQPAADAYLSHAGDMWDRETEYGRNRWELLDHCINQLNQWK